MNHGPCQYQRTEAREQAMLRALLYGPMSFDEVRGRFGLSQKAASNLLAGMVSRGLIERVERGEYRRRP